MDDRRVKILDIIAEKGKVKVSDISKFFKVSEVTVRNDLSILEKEGLLERVHGGAISTYKSYFNMSINERKETNKEEKIRIAKEVAKEIVDGDTILINSGTTAMFVTRELKNKKGITILSNSIPVAEEAYKINNGINIILLGGIINWDYQFTYGYDTVNQIDNYNVNKLILSIDGVSAENGISTFHHQEIEVCKKMINKTKHIIIAADNTKIGRAGFAHICQIEDIDLLVTDTKSNNEDIEDIRNKGIEVRKV